MSETGYSVGTCRYCGQCISLDRERETQEAADYAASETCDCYDARAERTIRKKIENAKDRIRKIFGSESEELGFQPIDSPETVFFSTSPYNEHITAIIGNHYFCEIGG